MTIPKEQSTYHPRSQGLKKLWFTNFWLFTLNSLPFFFPIFFNLLGSHPSLFHVFASLFPLWFLLSGASGCPLSHLIFSWNRKPWFPPSSTLSSPAKVQLMNKLAVAVEFLKPHQRITVCHVSQSLAQGDLPQVPGSEGVTVVVKHDCRIDCTEHCNSC